MTALTRIIKQRFEPQLESIKVKVSGIWVPLPLSKMLYVESSGHNVIFHMQDGSEFRMLASLREYFPSLNVNKNFLCCHKSYVVNLDYVTEMAVSEFILTNGEHVSISRQFRQISKSYYIN